MIVKVGLIIEVVVIFDWESVLCDVDFVCLQFCVGCFDVWISDECIFFKYGLIGQEINGFGGFVNVCCIIFIVLEIVVDME